MKTNTGKPIHTHEGGRATPANTPEQLRRSVMSCFLWEREFYEDGQEIADRIVSLAKQVDPRVLGLLAVEARQVANLRHAPLLLLSVLAETGAGRNDQLVSNAISYTISRADEMGELIAIHAARNKGVPLKHALTAQMKLGIADALAEFDEYQLAKYDRNDAVKLRDVIRLCHPKPDGPEQAALWKRVLDGKLARPDTWESALVGGADAKETFTRLLTEKKLGYLALLRNLALMQRSGVDRNLIRDAILAKRGADRVLPFRYVAAARAAPGFEPELDIVLCDNIANGPVLPGLTTVLVDVSGSMDMQLSRKSDLKRIDAAAALASIVNGDVRVFTFSDRVVQVPPRRGMAGVDAVVSSQPNQGTYLANAVKLMNTLPERTRLIVITDEQSRDGNATPDFEHAYMINVASAKNGVSYNGDWKRIDGFSENVIRWIQGVEHDKTVARQHAGETVDAGEGR